MFRPFAVFVSLGWVGAIIDTLAGGMWERWLLFAISWTVGAAVGLFICRVVRNEMVSNPDSKWPFLEWWVGPILFGLAVLFAYTVLAGVVLLIIGHLNWSAEQDVIFWAIASAALFTWVCWPKPSGANQPERSAE